MIIMSIEKYFWDDGESCVEISHDELIVRMTSSLEESGISPDELAEDTAFMNIVSTAVRHNDMELQRPVVGKVLTFFFAKDK